ncbi:hypothetical protein PENSPDRAFT_653564 [Peniophora sp. CONT]|nr:hypothetical protein PENSPDRAFT_653564 [Peniophora sp. CONT]
MPAQLANNNRTHALMLKLQHSRPMHLSVAGTSPSLFASRVRPNLASLCMLATATQVSSSANCIAGPPMHGAC